MLGAAATWFKIQMVVVVVECSPNGSFSYGMSFRCFEHGIECVL